ncbi:MAG: DUF2950 domain-containing protein [Candidatus Korobacteraceae bacterium]
MLFAVLIASPLIGQQSQPAAQAPAQGMAFDTPQQAADAVIAAAADYDVPKLMAIFGPDGEDFVSGGDQVQAKNSAVDFAQEAKASHSISTDPAKPTRATIIVGEEQWPFPVPLLQMAGKWYFDAKAGRKAILFRRIGANELDAITVCRGYGEAQREYSLTIHDDSGVNQYAQKIFSTPGKQDGLYWTNADGTSAGPIGDTVAKALEEGYSIGKGGFHGYYFKILKGQGPAAPMGKLDYVIEGIMIGGFALVAVPAEYQVTGVKTFIVSNDGVVYQKDLGPNSLDIVKNMELYNPDATWRSTYDRWPSTDTEVASTQAAQ